jgi:hypothetical protein
MTKQDIENSIKKIEFRAQEIRNEINELKSIRLKEMQLLRIKKQRLEIQKTIQNAKTKNRRAH